jgi:long-subunit fatty acid transport protein
MSKRISALIACLFFLTTANCFSQLKKDRSVFRFGVRAVNVYGDNVPFGDNIKIKPVIDLGFGMSYKLSKSLSFQPEIHYSPRGFKSTYRRTALDSTYTDNSLELHYLDICPNLNYVFRNRDSFKTQLCVWAGPYLGIGIAGRNVYSGVRLSERRRADSTFSNTVRTFGNGLNRIDYGFNMGVGIQVEKFTQIGISYSVGLNNVADDRTFQYYNQSIGVFVNVLFDDMF